jgi:hypothetical protein
MGVPTGKAEDPFIFGNDSWASLAFPKGAQSPSRLAGTALQQFRAGDLKFLNGLNLSLNRNPRSVEHSVRTLPIFPLESRRNF